MIRSQMSHTKLNMKQLVCNFEMLHQQMTEYTLDFLKPFFHSLQQKGLKVQIIEANMIPNWISTDWNLYKEILFHLLQNAIKFNNDHGSIKIIMSFHTMQDEFRHLI